MKVLGLVVGAFLVLKAVAPEPPPLTEEQKREEARADERWREQALVEAAKEAVRGKLKDPRSAEFYRVSVARHTGASIICGRVNARNGFGGYGDWMSFVSGGTPATTLVDERVEDFAKVWNTICIVKSQAATVPIEMEVEANHIPFASDAKARHTMISLWNEGEIIFVETRRVDPSWTSYVRRLVDCRRMLSKITGLGYTLEELKKYMSAGEMTPMEEGSISDVVSRFACAAHASRSKAKK